MHALTSIMHYSCIEHNVNSSIFAPQGNTFQLQNIVFELQLQGTSSMSLFLVWSVCNTVICNREIFFNINKFPGLYTKPPEPCQVSSSVKNDTTLTGLWARNCANIQQVLILKLPFGPGKLPSLLSFLIKSTLVAQRRVLYFCLYGSDNPYEKDQFWRP